MSWPRVIGFQDIHGWLLDGKRRSALGLVDEVSFRGNVVTFYFPVIEEADWEAMRDRDTLVETRLGTVRFVTKLERQGPFVGDRTKGDTLHAVQSIFIGRR